MNLLEVRKKLPELNGLNDESAIDVIHQSYYPSMDRSEVAKRLGHQSVPPVVADRPWYQDAKEVGRQFVGGLTVDLPRMAGNVIRRVSEDGGEADNYGRSMVEAANARAPGWEPNTQGEGIISGTLAKGARGLGPMVPILAASAIPVVGAVAGPALAATQFGLSSAQETEDKLRKQGIADDLATEAGWKTGLIQGPAEAVATAVGLSAFKPLAQAVGKASPTMTGVLSALTDTAFVKNFAKGMGINMVVQPGTEVAQDVGTEFVERSYGSKPEDAWAIAKDSAQAAVGMTALLGPFAFMAHRSNAQRAKMVDSALNDPAAPPEIKTQAMNYVSLEAKKRGVPEAEIAQWNAGKQAADTIRAEKVLEVGPLSKGANATIEARAQGMEATGQDPTNLPQEQGAPVDDPVLGIIAQLPDGQRQIAERAYAVINNPDAAKGVRQHNQKLFDGILEQVATDAGMGAAGSQQVNPHTGEIISAYDQRQQDAPQQQEGDILNAVTQQPFTNRFAARTAAKAATAASTTGQIFGPFELSPKSYVVRATPMETTNVEIPVAPLTRAKAIESGPAVVLQNRDRSSASSIAQMREIAARPDYLRTGQATVMDTGAPIVFGDTPAGAAIGHEQTIVDGKGDRVKVRYAVVDASDLIPSHQADGSSIAAYANGEPGKLRAVAGNGRAAGITEAYRQKTADQYRADLTADADGLGVDSAAIDAMKSPILVRIMDGKDVRPDIGDRSNIASSARMSPVEQAATDAKRLDLGALEFTEGGDPTPQSIQQFIRAMPTSEQGEMMNPDGTPGRQAIDRLMAATFKQAYGSDDLVQLYAQATDPEARTIMSALADAAGAMQALKDAGDWDIRGAVAEAAGIAINAKRKGEKLADYLKTVDMTTSGEAIVIAQFFAENIRSAKRMSQGLRDWATTVQEQVEIARSNETQDAMFGAAPTLSRDELFRKLGNGQRNEAQPDGAENAGGRAERQAVVAPAEGGNAENLPGNAAADEGLIAPTREDILAQQQAVEDKAAAEREADKADKRSDNQKESDRRAADILAEREAAKKAEVDAAGENFGLGQDAPKPVVRQVTAKQKRGQKSVFDEPAEPAKPTAESQPAEPKQASPEELRAKADLAAAMADLGDILGSSGRLNMMPEQQQKLFPVMVRLMDAAFKLGYIKFKDAAKFVIDQIRTALGSDTADMITLDHLQGAYITASSGRAGMDSKRAVIDIEDRSEIENHDAKTDNQRKEESHVPSTDSRVERDRQDSTPESSVGDAVQDDIRGTSEGSGRAGGQADRGDGRGQFDGVSVPFGSAPVAGEPGDQQLHSGVPVPELESVLAGDQFGERGGDDSVGGVPSDNISASQVEATADQSPRGVKATIERNKADKTATETANLANIRATLPQLLPGQQEDVLKAETRFADPKGYGMLFTNGTGTGKTFSGLGIIKRFANQGKKNTLIVVPDDKIASDWIAAGKILGLSITPLENTKDVGKGIVITSYANLGENDALASRQWDLVVSDEAHSLMQSADGKPTTYLHNLRAITYHPDGASNRYSMLHRDEIARATQMGDEILGMDRDIAASDTTAARANMLEVKSEKMQTELAALRKKLDASLHAVRNEVDAKQGAARTRMVALSATPFAYEKTIDWANGYLFDYKDGYPFNETSLGYNQPDPREYYFQTRFGYTMRFNKLTQPDAKVDSGMMQRMFNGELKKAGSLSGRMLDVAPDYDRRFVLVDSAIGNRIDEALAWLTDQSKNAPKDDRGMRAVADAINDKFKYLQKRFLLEAIKATEVIPIVKQHMAMGRKVVVFHDYKKGGGFNPFEVSRPVVSVNGPPASTSAMQQFTSALTQFNSEFRDLVRHPFADMDSPIEIFKRELPNVLLVNGDEKAKDLLARYKSFQDDASGPQVMLVQSAKNKGWSGHDTTGKHQRVLINLGQPTAPTLAIQQ